MVCCGDRSGGSPIGQRDSPSSVFLGPAVPVQADAAPGWRLVRKFLRLGTIRGLTKTNTARHNSGESANTRNSPAKARVRHAPRKTDSEVAPTTSIVVMGDDMADWLAYGLENVFSDSPEIGIVRKNKLYSGLLRYDAKSDLDWWHVARDTLAQEKADYVVMMLGPQRSSGHSRKRSRQRGRNKSQGSAGQNEAVKKDGQNPPKTKRAKARQD